MDTGSLLRVGTIAAMVAGSIWVLLPTMLQEEAADRFARSAASVEGPKAAVRADLNVGFDHPQPAEAAAVIEARLRALDHPVERVATDEKGFVVHLAPGGRREVVERIVPAEGRIDVVSLPEAGPVDDGAAGALAVDLAAALTAAGIAPATQGGLVARVGGSAEGLPALGSATSVVADQGVLRASLSAPLASPVALAVLDGHVVAALLADGEGARVVPIAGDLGSEVRAFLLGGRLVGPATLRAKVEFNDSLGTPEAAESQPDAPAWAAWLPDTRINMGLDLQGGLDLTLQVGVDDAIQTQMGRDVSHLLENFGSVGVTAQEVRADRTRPVLWIKAAEELSAVQTGMRQLAGDYAYSFSEEGSHAFEMETWRRDAVEKQAVEQVLETLRKRIDATGVKEPSIVKKGQGRINVQLPGLVDLQGAIDAIGTSAVLDFQMVDEEFDPGVLDRLMVQAEASLPEDQLNDGDVLNDWFWDRGLLNDDRQVLWMQVRDDEPLVPIVVKKDVVLTGSDVEDARVAYDNNQQPQVSLTFRPRGAAVFCEVTTANVNKRFAVVLDGLARSAPSITERICGGNAAIVMSGSDDPVREAQMLALVLRTGSLDAPVLLAEVRTVGAQLGAESIRAATLASLLGSALVVFYMMLWYKASGIVANIALTVNVLLMLASLAVAGATLTLPGIAGIALTVGMAVDANIIIYERIREELRLGVHPRKAVDVGFDRAAVAILDSNITTFFAGIVLFSYGTGPIKGFAVTLMIGIVTTLITALFVSRALMEVITRNSAARLSI